MSTILEEVTSFFHNATTGELSDAQRADITASSVKDYTPCANNPNLPECRDLSAKIARDVAVVAPSSGCVLNIPGMGCIAESWVNLFLVVGGSILFFFLLWTAIITSPQRRF